MPFTLDKGTTALENTSTKMLVVRKGEARR